MSLITQGFVSGPAAQPNYGGFAGRDCPDFARGTVLAVKWFDGREFQVDLVTAENGGEGRPFEFEIPWERIQTWIRLEL